MASTSQRIFKLVRSIAGALFNPGKSTGTATAPPQRRPATRPGPKTSARDRSHPAPRPVSNIPAEGLSAPYPGDFHGRATVTYSPQLDGDADPGEVVWTWVPYEEDYSQGKDRPVLVVGKAGKYLLALMMTTKDHSSDRRGDNDYIDIGPGSWDSQGRDSEVKLDRILQISPHDMRREGAILDKARFSSVAAGLRQRHGWK
ncbi:hypothetical protein ART_0907 [Arthrobacter sp. PAMC 25486]|uniref:type II toxin-antitoxin system PemK/MazF family toxin n=1 Tax=Arthrobacter sp. PAMC 25486 TaxID=1494608 RepID=UPI000535AA9E|nr:type II toxin-antitoxin system PemK/MazF family toxin [Arthrobacter sp. PAMC 25486]AIY00506.1 hypothetical protein ART_0907 [Arthrobacter sp. PAMC 25486]